MAVKRTWVDIEVEVKREIIKPMAVNRIMTRIGLTYRQFKKLRNLGVLEFVDSKQEYGGNPPKRYVANETKKKVSK